MLCSLRIKDIWAVCLECTVKHNLTTTMMNVCSHRNGNGVYSEPKRIYEPFVFAKACQCPWLTFINQ